MGSGSSAELAGTKGAVGGLAGGTSIRCLQAGHLSLAPAEWLSALNRRPQYRHRNSTRIASALSRHLICQVAEGPNTLLFSQWGASGLLPLSLRWTPAPI